MVFIKTKLYGNLINVEVETQGTWVDGELTPGGLSSLGRGIVMPWNVGKDIKMMEYGSYTTNDRKLYSNDILHDIGDFNKKYNVTIKGQKFEMSYISEWNEGSLNKYGLKKI